MCPCQIVYGYIPQAPIALFSVDTDDAPHLDVVAYVEQMLTCMNKLTKALLLLMLNIRLLVIKVKTCYF
jgi:hypothetical protein